MHEYRKKNNFYFHFLNVIIKNVKKNQKSIKRLGKPKEIRGFLHPAYRPEKKRTPVLPVLEAEGVEPQGPVRHGSIVGEEARDLDARAQLFLPVSLC